MSAHKGIKVKCINKFKVVVISVLFTVCNAENVNNRVFIGEVVQVFGTRVQIKVPNTENIHSGFQANLYHHSPFGNKIKAGEWRVTGIGNKMIEAVPVNLISEPTIGLLAEIKQSIKKIEIDTTKNHIVPWSNNNQIDNNTSFSSQQYVDKAKQISDDLYKNADIYSKEKKKTLWGKAIQNIQQAISLDNAEAYFLLALVYEDGYVDVKKDLNKMVANIQLSAEKGYAEAQYALGEMYADGDEVVKNKELGIYWLKKAIEQGHQGAKRELEWILRLKK